MRNIEDYAKKYEQEPCEKYQVRFRREKVLEQLEKYPHKKILEIGVGMEPLFPYIKNYDYVVIVEPAKKFVEHTENVIKQMGVGDSVTCIHGFFEQSIEQIKEMRIPFDYIIVSSLLHEVEQPDDLMNGIKDLCTNDTVVHLNVPNARSIHRILAREMGLIADEHEISDLQKKMQRKRVYDMESLSLYVQQMGFRILDGGSYFPKVLSAGQLEQMLELNIISENYFEGMSKLGKYFPENGSEIYVQLKRR